MNNTATNTATCPTVRKQIGKTTYIVRVHFSQTAKETMVHTCKNHKIFWQQMANLMLMKAPEQTLCFARMDLFFVFNFHPSNSLQNVLVPVYSNSKEFVVEFTSDDEKYGGYNQIAHQVYPVKEFNGQRFVELYIPARTAIVLREIKE